ncbi:uncharacterized protein LOC108162969 isoform X2 [Drosophila miranda]|uniref:uncharacterized protein LOC108162969 isoform X2 n=1 Tax=Drosophila miranda TaxID=7229 RepID=UPI00143F93EA|nr:uncharacterized protein LOC108162969 isoform X2 [Drosophila miranda]
MSVAAKTTTQRRARPLIQKRLSPSLPHPISRYMVFVLLFPQSTSYPLLNQATAIPAHIHVCSSSAAAVSVCVCACEVPAAATLPPKSKHTHTQAPHPHGEQLVQGISNREVHRPSSLSSSDTRERSREGSSEGSLRSISDTPQSIRTVATTTSPPKAFLLSAEHLDDASADDRGRVYKLRKKKYPSGGPHIT